MPALEQAIKLHELEPEDGDCLKDQARELLLEYGKFVLGATGPAQFCFGSLEKEAEDLPGSYRAQGGGCIIALLNDAAVGFVAWRRVAADVHSEAWEMKRLWTRHTGRGFGLGQILTNAVLERARDAGKRAVYLDTVPAVMRQAHELYLRLGFSPCEACNDNRIDGIAYLVKNL